MCALLQQHPTLRVIHAVQLRHSDCTAKGVHCTTRICGVPLLRRTSTQIKIVTNTSPSIDNAVAAFTSLPTIGKKTAQRITFFLLRQSDAQVRQIAQALLDLKANVRFCSECFNFTESDPCTICSSSKRDRSVICVVEEPSDVLAIEKTNEFNGLYHVLHGSLNPLDGIGPDDIKIRELVQRCSATVKEVILALNPNVEGEVTTQYLSRLLSPLGINVTRIARGIPIGSDLELADDATIARAIEGRLTV
jgi:recombination protein RecR